jgi:L-ribulose-5-phosphate 3-epimerase
MGSQRMKNPIGVMQGRLLPKYKGRYQAHPLGYWQDEFSKAAELGLDCIEFILDYNDADQNPLLTQEGCKEIQSVSARTGVKVVSVCADYFMESPLHSENIQKAEQSFEVLQKLLKASEELGVRDIVIPCVDQSSIRNEQVRTLFIEALTTVIPNAELSGVNLSLETDLNAKQFGELLSSFDSPRVTVNYDIGNSASLGYNPVEELSEYGERISDIHIKDRLLGGGSVKLGTGNADIPGFLKLIEQFDYCGPFIMQAYRDDEGLGIFKEQLDWVQSFF